MYNTNRKTGIDMKQRLAKFANCIPLWMQLSFFILIISTVTIFTLIFRNFTSIRNLTISNQYSLSQELLDLESENLDRYISELANFCIQPYYDNTFTRIINQKKPLSSAQIDYMKQQMYYYYYSRNDIQAYEIYLINQDLSIGRTENQEHIRLLLSLTHKQLPATVAKIPCFSPLRTVIRITPFSPTAIPCFRLKDRRSRHWYICRSIPPI